ncbi:MAG: hypothetical protein R3B70_41865 [Polyangiaceae bacterium]
MNVAVHVVGEQRVRHALHRRAREQLGSVADRDSEVAERAVEDIGIEGLDRAERDGIVAFVKRDRVLFGPDRVDGVGRVVDGKDDVERAVDRVVVRVEEAALVRDRAGNRSGSGGGNRRGAGGERERCEEASKRASSHFKPSFGVGRPR